MKIWLKEEWTTPDVLDSNLQTSVFHAPPLSAGEDQHRLSDLGKAAQSKILPLD